MDVKTTYYPSDPAIAEVVAEHGDRLVCVRYRYDAAKRKRYKTVELIVEEETWCEEVRFLHGPEFDAAVKRPVRIRVGPEEKTLLKLLEEHGARWDAECGAWRLRYDQAVQLGLKERIVDP